MQDSRLISLLQTFDKKALRGLRKYVISPHRNMREDVVALLDLIISCLKSGKNIPGKADVYHLIYGDSMIYDDHKMRMVMSFLFKLAEQFLLEEAYFQQEVEVKIRLAGIYRKRNLPKHFERALQDAGQALEKDPWRNADHYEREYAVQLEKYRFEASHQRIAEHNLQAITDNLDIAYFSQKLRQACTLLSHQAVYKKEYVFGLLTEILRYVEGHDLLHMPAISVYYYCYRSLTEPDRPEYFHRLKDLLVTERSKFPHDEIADLYILAINFCIRRYNEGDMTFLGDEFELIKEGLKQEYFLNNGVLSRFTYRNAVTLGLVLRDFEWVEDFIHAFRDKLEEKHRQAMYGLSLARLAFERRDFGTALKWLQKSEYSDLLLNLAAKALMLKIYYENDEYDALDSHLGAMQRFLHRKKVMGYHREHYLNLISFTKKMLEVYDRKDREDLRKEIEKARTVAEKGWLLGQL